VSPEEDRARSQGQRPRLRQIVARVKESREGGTLRP